MCGVHYVWGGICMCVGSVCGGQRTTSGIFLVIFYFIYCDSHLLNLELNDLRVWLASLSQRFPGLYLPWVLRFYVGHHTYLVVLCVLGSWTPFSPLHCNSPNLINYLLVLSFSEKKFFPRVNELVVLWKINDHEIWIYFWILGSALNIYHFALAVLLSLEC